MTLLATLHDLHPEAYPPFPARPETRTTARAILLDAEGHVALMHVGRKGYHKLPGGGLEGDETIEQGLVRELMEETGCTAEVLQPLGTVEEYRARGGFLQISHAFLACVTGPKGTPSFDVFEQADNFSIKWLPLAEALNILSQDSATTDYEWSFINRRETAILRAALSAI